MNQFDSISREQAEIHMPQALNCMDYFTKRFFKSLSEHVSMNTWVAGGAVRDYFSEGKVTKDVDFFAKDRHTMALLVLELRNKFGFKHFMITKNAIKGYGYVFGKKVDIDIVKKEFTSPNECIDAFDFTVCCFAVSADMFYYHKSACFDLIRKRLVVHKLPHPVDTFKRLNKYTKKGFIACNGTLLTIAKAIAEKGQQTVMILNFINLTNMANDNHFEYLQLQNDWNHQQQNETGGEDVSKVDKYKPHDYDYSDYYEKQEKADR